MKTARVLSAAPDAAIGAAFLVTWILPGWIGVSMLKYALLTMLLEFIVVHSSAFMGVLALSDMDRVRKTAAVLGLGAFYTVFVGAFALAFDAWWPLWAFWSLTLNRLTGMLFHTAPEGDERTQLATGWAIGAAAYLLWVIVTVIVPLPRLGITPDVVAAAAIPGSGEWVESPHRLLAAAVGYFFTQAYVELRGAGGTRVRSADARQQTDGRLDRPVLEKPPAPR